MRKWKCLEEKLGIAAASAALRGCFALIAALALAASLVLVVGATCAALPDIGPGQTDQPHLSGVGLAEGSAAFDPPLLHAGQEETFRLVYTAGPEGLPQGGRISVQDPDFHGMGWVIFQRFQTDDPSESGYLTVACSNPAVTLSLERVESAGTQDLCFTLVTVTAGSLLQGDTVTLTFGDTSVSAGGAAMSPQKAYQQVTWLVSTDTDGDDVYELLAAQPTLDIAPDAQPAHMFATAPTYVQQGAAFDLTVRVLDQWGNPCLAYSGTLQFDTTDEAATLPTDTSLPTGAGVRLFPITLNTTGIHYVLIADGGSFTINSNPIVVVDEMPSEQIFWGDLHGHHGHVYNYTVGVSPKARGARGRVHGVCPRCLRPRLCLRIPQEQRLLERPTGPGRGRGIGPAVRKRRLCGLSWLRMDGQAIAARGPPQRLLSGRRRALLVAR